ncbi:DUF2975 domain-containing protein [Streptomyces apocyni]|uniref:DUF2975 domain-containing protein n=1 Tax=Streptomyces apocyni TaxID=2654677 RepID=UPI0012EA438A|nr:DUF2975 domain-containing protein [Streptomyces apocyni]
MGTKSRWSWSRTDSRVLELGLGLATLLVGVFGVLLPVLGVIGLMDPADTRAVETEVATRVPDAVTDSLASSAQGDTLTLTGTHHADLVIADPSLGQRLLLVLPELVGSVLLVLILLLVFQIARTLRGGDVFAPRNIRRLSVIGVTLLVLAVLDPLLVAFTNQMLVNGTVAAEHVLLSVTFTGEFVLLAFLILALSEAFRRGAKLRADTEGLV